MTYAVLSRRRGLLLGVVSLPLVALVLNVVLKAVTGFGGGRVLLVLDLVADLLVGAVVVALLLARRSAPDSVARALGGACFLLTLAVVALLVAHAGMLATEASGGANIGAGGLNVLGLVLLGAGALQIMRALPD